MKWCPRERNDALIVAAVMKRHPSARCNTGSPVIVVRSSDLHQYREELADGYRSVFIRHMGALAGLDEHRATAWRLEHKLLQAHLIDHYAPGVIPVTAGASQFTAVPPDAVVKHALGDSSGDLGTWRAALPETPEPAAFVTDERLVVQQFVDIEAEFRVHSVEETVVDDLTFFRYRTGDVPAEERQAPNAFVASVLRRLPESIIGGSLWGWDVARNRNGTFVVIEVNVSGFHLVHRRGYQCSGYFHDPVWGAKSVARLLRHFRDRRGITVQIVCDLDEPSHESVFYREVQKWLEIIDDDLLTAEHSRRQHRLPGSIAC